MTYELRAPATEAEWSVYHEIRRVVLFERRGRGASYDPAHPDELLPNHYPLILWRNEEPLGVIRVDVDAQSAIFRRVAIREEFQRRGHGRALLAMAEHFAQARGCTRLESHVDAGAVAFYERCGFQRVEREKRGHGPVYMTRSLPGVP